MQSFLNAVLLMIALPVASAFSCYQGGALTVTGDDALCSQLTNNNFTSLPCVSGSLTADTCLYYSYRYTVTMGGMSCAITSHGGSCGFPGIGSCDSVKAITKAFLDIDEWTCATCASSNCNADAFGNPIPLIDSDGDEDASNAYSLHASICAVLAVAAAMWTHI
mmetsp:Transcript_52683/g.97533  ORF Transcript_52683/g.97533 Transcript_52683/m.97533 type:complete len:164 (-) Transcript_52683:361-852(-)